MKLAVMLDSGPLGRLAHADYRRNFELHTWLERLLDNDVPVFLPEIADYEVRRNLILEELTGSLTNLDALASLITYVPITTADMRRASVLWAQSRRTGHATGHPKELNADVILAAQAMRLRATVATGNLRHLSQLVPARLWTDITP
jgi:predicted nucleic acid-binding protein